MNSLHRWVRRHGIPGVSLFCLVGFVMGGCGVAQSRHDAVVAGLESVRADLENSRMMREALERDNEQLRADNEEAARELEVMGAEIQRIKEYRERERADGAALEKVSQARLRALQGLQRAYRKLQSENRAMQETVGRYQKELREARVSSPVTVSPSHHGASSAESMMDDNMAPESSPATTAINGVTKIVDLNTASMRDFVMVLGLSEPMAQQVIANRPYRLRGELIARQVLPPATFDVIKDRITAASR